MNESAGALFEEVLFRAALRVESGYLDQVRLTSRDAQASVASRERLYCYELYFHMRAITGSAEGELLEAEEAGWRIQCEVEKAGSYIEGNYVPDVIWHIPGTENNGHVIEVKRGSARRSALLADMHKLEHFLDEGYQRATLLIVGDFSDARLASLLKAAGPENRAQILLHRRAGSVTWGCRPAGQP